MLCYRDSDSAQCLCTERRTCSSGAGDSRESCRKCKVCYRAVLDAVLQAQWRRPMPVRWTTALQLWCWWRRRKPFSWASDLWPELWVRLSVCLSACMVSSWSVCVFEGLPAYLFASSCLSVAVICLHTCQSFKPTLSFLKSILRVKVLVVVEHLPTCGLAYVWYTVELFLRWNSV